MRRAIPLLLILALVAACQPAEPTSPPAASGDERLTVAASFSILADVAEAIAGDAADVISLVPRGEDPRTYLPEAAAIDNADIVFISGAGLEAAMTKLLAETETPVVEVSTYVGILSTMPMNEEDMAMEMDMSHMCPGDDMRAKACNDHYMQIDKLHEGRYNHTHEMGIGLLYRLDCQEQACDPYVWGDPHNVMLWAMQIRDTLSTMNPANNETYAKNTDAYLEDLLFLIHEEMKPSVATVPEENRTLTTSHDFLGYFAKPLGIELIQAEAPTETDAALYPRTLSEPDGPAGTYLDYMRHTTQTIVETLGGQMR